MPTRYYLPSTGAAAVSPAFDGSWEKSDQADRIKCVTTKIGSAMGTPARNGAAVNPSDTLVRQYVSDPIGAQTITGTVKGQVICMETANSNNLMAQLLIKVVSNDGGTVRGTALAHNTAALSNEFALTLTNRKYPRGWSGAGTTLTDVTAQDGDRIVIEVGKRQESTNSSSTLNVQLGDDGGTDLPEDETDTTTTKNPWIEFSMTIAGQGGGAPPTSGFFSFFGP